MVQPSITGDVNVKGIKIHYEYFGKKDGPVLIINNGVAMETSSWYQFLNLILEKVDVLLWDFRGQGQSTSDDQPYHIEELADYLKAIVDELKLEPKNINLLGVSYGSLVAVEFMRKYSKFMNRIVITGAILTNEKNYYYKSQVSKKIIQLEMMDIWADSLYSSLFSESFLKTIESFIPKMKEALCLRYKNRKIALVRLVESEETYLLNVESYYPEFKKINTPILMLGGEHDNLIPTFTQKKINKLFPNIKYIEYPECGHLVYMEKPKEFFTQTLEFITK